MGRLPTKSRQGFSALLGIWTALTIAALHNRLTLAHVESRGINSETATGYLSTKWALSGRDQN